MSHNAPQFSHRFGPRRPHGRSSNSNRIAAEVGKDRFPNGSGTGGSSNNNAAYQPPLFKQTIRGGRSGDSVHPNRQESYVVEIREGPEQCSDPASGRSSLYPWVQVRFVDPQTQPQRPYSIPVAFPVSLCERLSKHLLSARVFDNEGEKVCLNESESFADSGVCSGSGDPVLDDVKNLGTHGVVNGGLNRSEVQSSLGERTARFELENLSPLRIVCEDSNCVVEIIHCLPVDAQEGPNESEHAIVYLKTSPLDYIKSEPNQTASGGQNRPPRPWETEATLELRAALLGQFINLLYDIGVRYRTLEEVPEIPYLLCPSGARRFFFDLRTTPWGTRVHISQVTDLHRNVIGIPLESLVLFRDRLTELISALSLDGDSESSPTRPQSQNRASHTVISASSGGPVAVPSLGGHRAGHEIRRRRRRRYDNLQFGWRHYQRRSIHDSNIARSGQVGRRTANTSVVTDRTGSYPEQTHPGGEVETHRTRKRDPISSAHHNRQSETGVSVNQLDVSDVGAAGDDYDSHPSNALSNNHSQNQQHSRLRDDNRSAVAEPGKSVDAIRKKVDINSGMLISN